MMHSARSRSLAIVFVLALWVLFAMLLPGCALPAEARRIIAENAALQTRFVVLMDAGKVSQEQLEENARANAENWRRLDVLVGD